MRRTTSIIGSALAGGLLAGGILFFVNQDQPRASILIDPAPLSSSAATAALVPRDRAVAALSNSDSATALAPLDRAVAALSNSDSEQRTLELVDSLSAWVESDGEAALEWAEANLDETERKAVLPDVLATWAQHDREGLIQWFREGYNPQKDQHRVPVRVGNRSLGVLIVRWLALEDPVRAAEFALHDLNRFRTNIVFGNTETDLVASIRSSEECRRVCEVLLPFYEKRGYHMVEAQAVLSKWRELDPDAAKQFLEIYPAPERNISFRASREMTKSDVAEAGMTADSLLAQTTDEDRAMTIHFIVGGWKSEGLDQARAWLEALGESEDTHDGRIMFARRIIAEDPATAFALIDPVPDGPTREAALEAMLETWAATDLDAVLKFLDAQKSVWPKSKIDRLRELSVTTLRKALR